MVIVIARSRAGFFPIRSAFPAFAPGRPPHRSFRGLLKLHTRYSPPNCLPTIRGLCHEVSTCPVTRACRSPAIESNHQLFEWVLPPLVISPLGAHAKAPAPPAAAQQHWLHTRSIGCHSRSTGCTPAALAPHRQHCSTLAARTGCTLAAEAAGLSHFYRGTS
jgi:hypothetical protein